eukprot:CAMPEP_0173284878 /NCGR_PEP_ID=MMETSP1143-20121109/8296_1 /TAXON_ID=483371 /ORGANISM="non described non described, Strain CCMP2298" /LENGTH=603 /DNA_ID=CAMNT_0014222961 /DNA_START=85 /DNA_END=1893 /DNA_ORIENTATION=+
MSSPQPTPPTIVHMWCGPRSLSTATMYSFAQRPDCQVLDEPLYAHWLARNPLLHRPYRAQLLSTQDTDGNAVLRDLEINRQKPLLFLKHISKMAEGIDRSLLCGPHIVHLFLVRDPLAMIASWDEKAAVHGEECSHESMGLPMLLDLYSYLRRHSGREPVVVDSDSLRDHSPSTLPPLCAALGLPFHPQMLSWTAGPKAYDGLWAEHDPHTHTHTHTQTDTDTHTHPPRYDGVHKSTGFAPRLLTGAGTGTGEGGESGESVSGESVGESGKAYGCLPALSLQQLQLYREALPFFLLLQGRAVGRDPLDPGSSPAHVTHVTDVTDVTGVTVVDHGLTMRLGVLPDPRNADLLVWVGDRLMPREQAKVSVFDSSVQGGDACWEGLRVYQGRVFKLHEHISRLLDSAQALAFANVPSRQFVLGAIFQCLSANGMRDGVHIRLTLSRGAKLTSSMNPQFNVFGCLLIVLPEWKPVGDPATYDNNKGIRLITACNRRNSPQCVDSKIHHNNLINNILPKIQANVCGAADALMLDLEGFVSETNATNIFMAKRGVLLTPHADYCLPGVTRHTVMQLATQLGIPVMERRISLAEFQCADEVFTTGTMGEL